MSSRILGNSLIYLGSSILSKSIPFLLLPILTYYLTTEEYGRLAIYLMMINFYLALIGMNLHTNVSRNFFRVSREEMSNYIGNMIILLFATFTIYLLITFFVSLKKDYLFSIPIYWVLLVPAISLFMMVNNIFTTVLRNENKATQFGTIEVSITAVIMGITILGLIAFSFGWYSQVVGILISYFVFSIVALIYLKNNNYLNMKVDIYKLKSILQVSLPLIPHVIGSSIINLSDRLFIEKLVDINSVGVYSVGYMFGMIVMLFSDAFIKAWSPWFYKHLQNPSNEVKRKIVRYTYLYILGIFILAIFISIVGVFILPFFVNEKFQAASQYIFWISISYAVFGVYQIFFPYLVHINRTSFLAISTVTAAIVNLILNYFFIDYFGAIGAAYATIAAFLVSALMVIVYTQKKIEMPWVK